MRTVVGFVNATLAGDSLWGAVLPLSSAGGGAALFSAVHDGTLLCRLVGAVAQREVACTRGGADGMSLFDCEANVERALHAARLAGCAIPGVSAQALIEGEPVSVMTMVWQLLHLKLIKPVSVHAHPELFSLVMPGEEDAVVPEELLLRWLNHHLRLANRPEQARAWAMSEVLRNGVGFAVVLTVAPPAAGASLAPLSLPDATARAAAVVSS